MMGVRLVATNSPMCPVTSRQGAEWGMRKTSSEMNLSQGPR